MEIPVSEAKAQLTELVRRAETGEDIVLTRHGQAVARLVPARAPKVIDRDRRMAFLQKFAKESGAIATSGPAAHQADHFLYGDDGLPK